MNAAITYTAEYERFFRDHAQFFPPCDDLIEREWREDFKQFGAQMFAHMQEEVDEAKLDLQAQEELHFKLVENIVRQLASLNTDTQKLIEIHKLIE